MWRCGEGCGRWADAEAGADSDEDVGYKYANDGCLAFLAPCLHEFRSRHILRLLNLLSFLLGGGAEWTDDGW